MKRQSKNKWGIALVLLLSCSMAVAAPSTASQSGTLTQEEIQQLLHSTQATANTNATNNADKSAGQANASNLNSQAFSATVRNMLPLSPEQIKTLRYLLDQSQRAAAESPSTPPRPTSSTVPVNLAPGATPPVIRLSAGFVTSLVFTDATGAPWPIQAYDLGNPHDFNVQWDKQGNTLMVQALDHYEAGNLAVMLKGMNTPIMLTLLPGQRAVDYRVDLRIPRLGPQANPVLSGLPDTANPVLLNVLDGIPPKGAQRLQVQGGSGEAWLLDNHVFLRTNLTVLSPAWISATSSADGTNAYELPNAPVILASSNGQMVTLTLQDS